MFKTKLIASFTYSDKLSCFIEHIKNRLKVDEKDITIYQNDYFKNKFLILYKLHHDEEEIINLNNLVVNHYFVSKVNDVIFTSKAYEQLIEEEYNLERGNIDYDAYKIDLNKYKNHMLLVNNGKLLKIKIKPI